MTDDTPRARLLRAGEELLYRRDKIADLSLRGLAAELGTSHRMLIHHFDSRDGFFAALLTEMRREEQEALRDLYADGSTYRAAMQLLEERYLNPALHRRFAAFFYVLGLAVQDPQTYREFLDSLDDWTTLFTTLGERDGLDPEAARARAHALVWTTRGLIVNGLTTGDLASARTEFQTVARHLIPNWLLEK